MTGKRIAIPIVILAIVLTVGFFYGGWFRRDSGLQGSGTVEARNIRVGSEVGGGIDKVLVREGDNVNAGQVLMPFDDKDLLSWLQQSRTKAEKEKHGFRREDIQEARAAAAQAKADFELKKNGYRREDVAAAQADLERAAADETRTHLDFQRYDTLAQKNEVSKQQRDTAEANWKMAAAQKDNAQHKLDELQRGYRPEEIASAEAHYLQAQATLDKFVRGNRPEDVDAAQAALAYDQARFREREVLAPSASTVEVLDVRPGDLIAPNTPVATLLERDQIYVRIYIPETEIWRVKIGQMAQ